MRIPGVVLLAVVAGGCTTVKLEQREGCWVRQTSRWPSQVKEELGPCEREKPAWSEDRLTRLVQECMVQADYRWKTRALAAWNKGNFRLIPEAGLWGMGTEMVSSFWEHYNRWDHGLNGSHGSRS